MRYKTGQKLVCTAKNPNWIRNIDINKLTFWERLKLILRGNRVLGPVHNEIVTFVHDPHANPGFIALREYEKFGNYDERHFEPLVAQGVLEAELKEIFTSVCKN